MFLQMRKIVHFLLIPFLFIACSIDLTDSDDKTNDPGTQPGEQITLSGNYIWVGFVLNDQFSPISEDRGEILSFSGNSCQVYDYRDGAIDSSSGGIYSIANGYLTIGSTDFPISVKGDSLILIIDNIYYNRYVPYSGTIPPSNWITTTPDTTLEGTFLLVGEDLGSGYVEEDGELLKFKDEKVYYYEYDGVDSVFLSILGSYSESEQKIYWEFAGEKINLDHHWQNDTLVLVEDANEKFYLIRYNGPIPPSEWGSVTVVADTSEVVQSSIVGAWGASDVEDGVSTSTVLSYYSNGTSKIELTILAYEDAEGYVYTGSELEALLELNGIINPFVEYGTWETSQDSLFETYTIDNTQYNDTSLYWISNDSLYIDDGYEQIVLTRL